MYWECSARGTSRGRCPALVVERDGAFQRGRNQHTHEAVSALGVSVALAVDVRKTARDDLYSSHEAVSGLGVSVALAEDVRKTARDDLYSSHEAVSGLGVSVALAVDVRKTARDCDKVTGLFRHRRFQRL